MLVAEKVCVSRKGEGGFSLMELLLALVVIMTLAAVAIPNLMRARMAANEASAVASLRTVANAMMEYQAAYPNIGFAVRLANLGGRGVSPCTPTTSNACLIDDALAAGVKSGYEIAATGLADVNSGINTAFQAGAAPISYNRTGAAAFCATEDGSVRSDSNQSGKDTSGTSWATCHNWGNTGSSGGGSVVAR